MRYFTTILTLLISTVAGAQSIRISDFKPSIADAAAPDAVLDADGALCAVLRMETRESGWTFEAGMAGITDVMYGTDVIYVYVPAGARILSVAHPNATPLRNWDIPQRLEPGRTYTMKLEIVIPKPKPVEKPRPVVKQRVAPAPPPPTVRHQASEKDFCWHFTDAYLGFVNDREGYTDECFIGIRYTYMQYNVGPYISAAFSTDEMSAFFTGAAYRFTRPESCDLDIQAYGGIGLVYGGQLGGEAGIRFGWKSEHKLSGLDFGVGCQFWKGAIVPTVEVGLYIWGIPVVCGLALALGAF